MGVPLGTKAETLERLRPKLTLAAIAPLRYFAVSRWRNQKTEILDELAAAFASSRLVVRSSAQSEDTSESSMAGAYASVLDVDAADPEAIRRAVESVVGSMGGQSGDQVLVQPMLDAVSASGVITTHVLDDGAPYYVMNYDDESGRTDSVTGGTGVNKTVLLFRDTELQLINSERVRRWLEMTRELETLIGPVPLDIEFAERTDGQIYVLQVRPIASTHRWQPDVRARIEQSQAFIEFFIVERSRRRSNLLGRRTILGEMPDWNPAEIIGTAPRRLASSLYRRLVTRSVWRQARAAMGYREPLDEDLMVTIGGRPYIDVRNSFNSFIPATLADDVGERIVDGWLDYLDAHPELHDKVEFKVAHTVLDLDFERSFTERYGGRDRETLAGALRALTLGALVGDGSGSMLSASRSVTKLESIQTRSETAIGHSEQDQRGFATLMRARNQLDLCSRLGTLPFAILARHAFIAEALLRSSVARGALAPQRLQDFRRSLRGIASEFAEGFHHVVSEGEGVDEFLSRFGHLRPGTYDIRSSRYDQRESIFEVPPSRKTEPEPRIPFALNPSERRDLQQLLKESGFSTINPDALLRYASRAIRGREWSKFVFTRSLSDALEAIASWGHATGLDRDQLSHLDIDTILNSVDEPPLGDAREAFADLAEQGRQGLAFSRSLQLGYLIRDTRDIYVVPLHRSMPNFVGSQRLEAAPVEITTLMIDYPTLTGRIVCIENADPGFDWIFTREIAGLVTKFGGSNSHMAIRCAEFGLPAAIGCGEQVFDRLTTATRIELDCGNRLVRPIHG